MMLRDNEKGASSYSHVVNIVIAAAVFGGPIGPCRRMATSTMCDRGRILCNIFCVVVTICVS